MSNHLQTETSPYLLEHAENPVDWYPWGEEALEKARREDKPIFLSIGYAACHWCHVMARESFEDPEIASYLNNHFVSIKVDREERPDLDTIYMNAVVTITGQGGWPMSVFLSPDARPFFGGTYFPPTPRYGMPSFRQVLESIVESWTTERAQIDDIAKQLSDHLRASDALKGSSSPLQENTLGQAAQTLISSYDRQDGGWGGAPKFPQAMAIDFLLTQATRGNQDALDVALHALRAMSRGGMYDVVGGGFHRYSVDARWLVPHFEKMLYDNALLARSYLHAYQLTGDADLRRVCEASLDFIARELAAPDGGFYSSLDADSEGVEGKYYVWSEEELRAALRNHPDADLFFAAYPISPSGNFEGKNILQRARTDTELAERFGMPPQEIAPRLNRIHAALRRIRDDRIRPRTDDKVLAGWSALAIQAFAEAARVFDRPDYLRVATRSANFILSHLLSDGRLLRSWRSGEARHAAYLQDYAGLILALLSLYQADPDPRWYSQAVALHSEMLSSYADPQGGFFDTRAGQPGLLTRPKETQDNAVPSGSAQAALALLILPEYGADAGLKERAVSMLGLIQAMAARHPTAFGFWLSAIDFAIGPVKQIAVVGDPSEDATQAMLQAIAEKFRPRTVLAVSADPHPAGSPPLLSGRGKKNGLPTAYVCEGFTCRLPVNSVQELIQQL